MKPGDGIKRSDLHRRRRSNLNERSVSDSTPIFLLSTFLPYRYQIHYQLVKMTYYLSHSP